MAERDFAISDPMDRPESPSQIIGRRRNRLVNIIKQNDLPQLRHFIATYSPDDVIAPWDTVLGRHLVQCSLVWQPRGSSHPLEGVHCGPGSCQQVQSQVESAA